MKRIVLAVTAAALFMCFSASNADALVDFKVEGRYWFTTLDSNVKISDTNVLGTDINLVDDLGLDEKKGFPEARILLGIGSHKVRYAFTPLSWDGKKNITETIKFGGKTYTLGNLVKTSLDMDYHRLGYEYDFIDLLSNKVGVIIEAKYLDFDVSLSESLTGKKESGSFGLPIPAVGVTGQVGLPMLFNISAEVTGMSFGSYGKVIDAEAAVNFNPIPLFTVSAGYRIFKLELEADSGLNKDSADLNIKGPFVLVRFGF
ncbi:MAG: hypothetical protein OEV59_09875 [Deltaproteobacteria bacterium]|nr:hypothetical protein [Deltaproteobacteria bacterium]